MNNTNTEELKKELRIALRWPDDLDGLATDMDTRSDLERVIALMESRERAIRAEVGKAYGGCTNCYGKGYATSIRVYESYVDFGPEKAERWYPSPIVPCPKCERGKEIKKLLAEYEGKIEEAHKDGFDLACKADRKELKIAVQQARKEALEDFRGALEDLELEDELGLSPVQTWKIIEKLTSLTSKQ